MRKAAERKFSTRMLVGSAALAGIISGATAFAGAGSIFLAVLIGLGGAVLTYTLTDDIPDSDD